MAKLIVTDANNVRREFPLAKDLTIGRSTGNQVQLAEGKASRSHCRVRLIDGKFHLEDLKSSNGTEVNGQRITEHLLCHGDKIIIGGTTIIFEGEQLPPEKAAEQGAAKAQNSLELANDGGPGVPNDDAESVKRHRKAAEQGDAEAQNSLGLAYEDGVGAPQDAAEAVKWYRKAAEQGHAKAQFNLGLKYAAGEGVVG